MAEFSQPLSAAVIDISFSSSVAQKDICTPRCYTILPIRRHKNLQAFDRARREMHALWEKYLQDGFVKKHFGTEGAKTGDWCALIELDIFVLFFGRWCVNLPSAHIKRLN